MSGEGGEEETPCRAAWLSHPPHSHPRAEAHRFARPSPQLKARCEELRLDWPTLSLEKLLKEKQALKSQISEKQRRCLELQVGAGPGSGGRWRWGFDPVVRTWSAPSALEPPFPRGHCQFRASQQPSSCPVSPGGGAEQSERG